MAKARRYEGSPQDRVKDRKGAKKAGVSMRVWEGSKADKRADAAGQKKLNARATRRK